MSGLCFLWRLFRIFWSDGARSGAKKYRGSGQSKNSRKSNRLPSVKQHIIRDTSGSEDFLVADLAPADRKVQNGRKRKQISPIDIKVNDHYSNVFLRISARLLIENFSAKDGSF